MAHLTIFIRIDAHGDYPDNYVERLLDEAIMNQADSVVVSMDTVGKSGFQKNWPPMLRTQNWEMVAQPTETSL
ncbi:hypothetical protein QW180_18915 [Vibrio sinaloensis]|nr:hypothetical protein [Vibrio sinaloensis]